MHHNVYVEAEQHKKAEPPPLPSPPLFSPGPTGQFGSKAAKQPTMIQTPRQLLPAPACSCLLAVLFVPRKCSTLVACVIFQSKQ